MGAYKLPVTVASVCPFSGIGYSRVSESEDRLTGEIILLTVPVGLGLGRPFESTTQNFAFTVYASP